MAVEKMKRYNLNVNGVDHTIRLNEEDADAHREAFGDKLTDLGAKARPASNKSRTASNKAGTTPAPASPAPAGQ